MEPTTRTKADRPISAPQARVALMGALAQMSDEDVLTLWRIVLGEATEHQMPQARESEEADGPDVARSV